MAHKAPGKAHRKGISLIELTEMLPNEQAAKTWFEARRWPDGPTCPHCASTAISAAPTSTMPWRCRACRKRFSVRTGTVMAESKLPLRKWAIAIYLHATSLKSVSSMKLHRDLNITQKSAWFLGHRIREALSTPGGFFGRPVEVDEAHFGGKERNKPLRKRKKLGRGPVGKTTVVGAKDRKTGKVKAKVVTPGGRILRGFVHSVSPGAQVYTDENRSYVGLRGSFQHEAVKHGVGEYQRHGTHKRNRELLEHVEALLSRDVSPLSQAHAALHRRIRHEARATSDTADLMGSVVASMIGKRLTYATLIS